MVLSHKIGQKAILGSFKDFQSSHSLNSFIIFVFSPIRGVLILAFLFDFFFGEGVQWCQQWHQSFLFIMKSMLQQSHHTYIIRGERCQPLNTSPRGQSCQFSWQIASLPKLLQNTYRRLLKQRDANKIYDVLELDPPQISIMNLLEALGVDMGIDTVMRNKILHQLLQRCRKRQLSYLIYTRSNFLEVFYQTLNNFETAEEFEKSHQRYKPMIFALQVMQSLINFIQLNQTQTQLTEALQNCGISRTKAIKLARTLRLNMQKNERGNNDL